MGAAHQPVTAWISQLHLSQYLRAGGGQRKAENAAADGKQLQKSHMWCTRLHRSEHRRVLFMSLAVQGIRIGSFFSPHVR